MFFVSGITGHIGGEAARSLLDQGKQVRSLVRNPGKASEWSERGVDLREGSLTDPEAVASALKGVKAAFLMQPTPIGVTRDFPKARALTDGIVGALKRTPPPAPWCSGVPGASRNSRDWRIHSASLRPVV